MSDQGGGKFSGLTTKLGLAPQEAPAKTASHNSRVTIGIPNETKFQEHRIGLTPSSVKILHNYGYNFLIERGAGDDSNFSDNQYSESGAEIVEGKKEIFESDMIIKVSPLTEDEINLLTTKQTILSPLHVPTLKKENINALLKKKTTALAFEYMKEENGTFPFVTSMSEIAGVSCILIAAQYLSNANDGIGKLLGGIAGVPPAKVVIFGAGVVGTNAAHAALGLGASVTVFDNNTSKLRDLQHNINQRIYTSILNPKIIERELRNADVAIGAIHSDKGQAPVIVSEETVQQMKPGSIIIDVSIDQGGCFATSRMTTHDDPVFLEYDVIHYCVPNIPSRVSRTASYAISNVLTPFLQKCADYGGLDSLLYEKAGLRNGVYVYQGFCTNEHISDRFGLKLHNFDLLFATKW